MRTSILLLALLAGCGPLDEDFDAGQPLPRDAGGPAAKTPLQLCEAGCSGWAVLETTMEGTVCHCAAESPQQTMARCSSECPRASSISITYASPGALGVCRCNL